MTKITTAARKTIRAIIAASREYDPATMRIGRDGVVSARKDADKTFAGNDPARYFIARVEDMVGADGSARDGWL